MSSIAVFFFVLRPRSACFMERAFSLMGRIQIKDRLDCTSLTSCASQTALPLNNASQP